MVRLTVLIITVVLVAGIVEGEEKTNPGKRIIGGSEATEGEFPYQVALRKRVNQDGRMYVCSGSIISPLWVMTAALCTQSYVIESVDRAFVVAGTNSRRNYGDEYKVEKIINHEDFNRTSFENNISLLKLAEEIKYGPKVGNIALPTSNTPGGLDLIVSGWGYTNKRRAQPENLLKLNVKSLSVEECQKSDLKEYDQRYPITEKQLCTYKSASQSTCGDFGNPLAHDGEIVGVGSLGLCASGKPDVFIRVFAYLDWIKKNTGLEGQLLFAIVVVGTNSLTSGGDRYNVSNFIPHENYDEDTYMNDIAALKIDGEFTFSDKINAIKLPSKNIGVGVECLLTGWGSTDGDSGGPLVSEGELVGILAWGIPCARGYPDVYTRVYTYLDWINRHISN